MILVDGDSSVLPVSVDPNGYGWAKNLGFTSIAEECSIAFDGILKASASKEKFSAVLLSFGLWSAYQPKGIHREEPHQFLDNMIRLIRLWQERGSEVYVLTPHLQPEPKPYSVDVARYGILCRAAAIARYAPLIDIEAKMRAEEQLDPACYIHNDFHNHLSVKGQQLVERYVKEAVL